MKLRQLLGGPSALSAPFNLAAEAQVSMQKIATCEPLAPLIVQGENIAGTWQLVGTGMP